MKRVILISIMFFISVFMFAEPPTFINFTEVYDENPEIIYEMVYKLYVIEHTEPVINYPIFELFLLEKKMGYYLYELVTVKNMDIEIGIDPYNLLYSIDLQPNIMKGYIEETGLDFQGKLLITVIVGGALFIAGMILGLQF